MPGFLLPLCFLLRTLWDCYLILLRVNFCEQQSTLYQRRWCLSDNSAGLMMMILLAVKRTHMAVRTVIPGWLGGGRDNPGCGFFSKLPSPDRRPGAGFHGCAVCIPVGPGVRASTSQSLPLVTFSVQYFPELAPCDSLLSALTQEWVCDSKTFWPLVLSLLRAEGEICAHCLVS